MNKIKLIPVSTVPTVNVDAAINKAADLWKALMEDIQLFGEDHKITQLTRAHWMGARELIDALGVTNQYLAKCREMNNEK